MINSLITKVRRISDSVALFISNRVVYLSVDEKKVTAYCVSRLLWLGIAFIAFMLLCFIPHFLKQLIK